MALFPILVVDYTWRINVFAFVFFAIHSGFVINVKPPAIALDDMVNCFVFLIIGIFVGNNIRMTKIQNLLLQKQKEHLSEVDFLTGLYNRRKMYEVLHAAKENLVKGTILMDIDYFKGYNDTYGHQAGDQCLSQIGSFLKIFALENDILVFRYGGEEFIAFTYRGEEEYMLKKAEQIRQGILDLHIAYPEHKAGKVSISAGCCANDQYGSYAIEKMISNADKALYKAKSKGRNRCEVHTERI